MLPEYSTNLFMAFFWLSAMSTLGLLAWSKHWVSNRKQVCLATAALAVATIGLLGYLIADHYTGVGINDAALFHVGNGMTGLQQEMWLPIAGVLLCSFLCLGLVAYVLSRAARQKILQPPVHRRRFRITGLVLVVLAILINPGFSQTGALFTASWLAQRNVENVMEHAQSPAPFVPSEGDRPVSAVYIYAEGLEAAFMDEAKFPGLMPNLNRLSKTAVQIRGIKQVSFTGWTAAGQIASNCGFPGLEGQVLFAADGSRWPCASNLLAKDGYEMVYLNGSSLEFADKGAFWRDRGYAKAYGDREVNRLAGFPKATLSAWGAYDDMLMEASWNEYQRLNQQEKPFVLTLLTVDTHAPLGLETPSCKSIPRYTLKGKDAESAKLLQAVHCADHLLGGLLDRMLPTLPQDTVVIVQSDHLQTPRADVFPLLGAPSTRDNLFLAWGSDHAPGVVSRQATMFDVAPTFLSLLNRKPVALNLGRDLLSPEHTLVETHGMPWLEQRMLAAMTDHRMGEANFVEHQRDKEADARMRGERSRPRPFGDPHLGKQLPSETVPASKKIPQSTPASQ